MMRKKNTFSRFKQLIWAFPLLIFIWTCNIKSHDKNISQNIIKEYHIKCDNQSLESMFEKFESNLYIPIKITYNEETCAARMRIRGDTSRKNPKKSLKIKFDSLKIDNIPKIINLNAEYSDRSYIRQYLSSKLMQQSGQTCFNSEHVKVFINGKFHGLYLQVENMDATFLERNNLDKKGNLYKATRDGACLSIFDDFDLKWEKKTNKKNDHNDLIKLIHDLNTATDSQFQSLIKNRFEYDELINLIALNMMLSNGSTYYHNYYLYHDLYHTEKWKMIPWDMDKTLSYYNWKPYTYHRTSSKWESDNPLIERAILCKPIFNDIKKRIFELHKSSLNDKKVSPTIDSLSIILEEIITLDKTDKISSVKKWYESLDKEKKYFDKHYKLLQKQFTQQPESFNLFKFNQVQTGLVTFKWRKSEHPANKAITYILSYGSDFLLSDSTKTSYLANITDTFFTLTKQLPKGKYYWKVTAYDGEYYTDGFNTKNIFEVEKAIQ